MCRYRRVCNVFSQCGHLVPSPEQIMFCSNARCKFSPNHPPSCQGPACIRSCIQYRQSPEQYSPHINGLCPACT